MQTSVSELAGRRVLVSGAGSGIGLATACTLAQNGARVAAVVQTQAQQESLLAVLPQACVFVQDLLDAQACAALPSKAMDALGGLDALACCAGVFFKKGSDDTSLDEWRQTLSLNLESTFILTRAAIACMRQQALTDASVVVISSQLINSSRFISNSLPINNRSNHMHERQRIHNGRHRLAGVRSLRLSMLRQNQLIQRPNTLRRATRHPSLLTVLVPRMPQPSVVAARLPV
jgi:NAD(P)-dependent dehydrogenase (short-subunit alcohol dehydrogenase family)